MKIYQNKLYTQSKIRPMLSLIASLPLETIFDTILLVLFCTLVQRINRLESIISNISQKLNNETGKIWDAIDNITSEEGEEEYFSSEEDEGDVNDEEGDEQASITRPPPINIPPPSLENEGISPSPTAPKPDATIQSDPSPSHGEGEVNKIVQERDWGGEPLPNAENS